MIYGTRHVLGWAAGGLLLIAASAPPASAAGPFTPIQPKVLPAYGPANILPQRRPPIDPPNHQTRLPGSDWWRIYPWSPYNAWKNPYWYPPYNTNYPYPPDAAYPVYPYPVPSPAPLLPARPALPDLPLGAGYR
jgi:hypothetical protein